MNLKLEKLFTVSNWLVIAVVAGFISIATIWFYVFRVDNKILSIINFYPSQITLKYAGKEINLKAFDAYTDIFNSRNDFQIQAYDSSNKLLKSIDVNYLSKSSELIEAVISPNNKYCFVESDVTSFYRNNENKITNVEVLSSEPDTLLVLATSEDQSVYTYPGKVLSSAELNDIGKNIQAVLPLKCSDINNDNKIFENVKLFSSYDADAQRKYYNDKLQKINSSNSVQELSNF